MQSAYQIKNVSLSSDNIEKSAGMNNADAGAVRNINIVIGLMMLKEE